MKKFPFLFLLIFINILNSFSQTSFIKTLEAEGELGLTFSSAIQLEDGSYILAGCTRLYINYEMDSVASVIYKLDSLGEVIATYTDFKPDSAWFVLGVKEVNEQILTYELIKHPSNYPDTFINSYIHLTKYDYDLNVVEQKKYMFPLDTVEFIYWTHIKEHNNAVFIYGIYGEPFIWKITEDTTIFREYEYNIYDLEIIDVMIINNYQKTF